MANRSVRGRIVFAGTDQGIENLTVTAVDFDPFFHEDDVLKTGKTDSSGRFILDYSPGDYSYWKGDRAPDIVVRVYGPRFSDPEVFGTRLLHETDERKNVTDEVLLLEDFEIHPDNIDGWLVTNATLNPSGNSAVPVIEQTEIRYLIDGADLFPEITKAAKGATQSINLMNLHFGVGKKDDIPPKFSGVITQFTSSFDSSNPPASGCRSGIETTLEVELKKQAHAGKSVNVMVSNIPLTSADTASEVRRYFEDSPVVTSDYMKGLSILHGRAMVLDGVKAFVMGSSIKQGYFSDQQHAIQDARHGGTLMHDVHLQVAGPAVARINETFATIWKSTGKTLPTVNLGTAPAMDPARLASVQVVRTLPGGVFTGANGSENLPEGETTVLEAYERAINNAERYIYLENQYFTSPEIIDALIGRMKDPSKPKLQIIIALNFKPDLPGYPDRQITNIFQLKRAADKNNHQLEVFTLWSRSEVSEIPGGPKKLQIMPIYIHSKVAIIDDKWATVGSANLDGTSLNYHEVGLIITSAIADKLIDRFTLKNDFGRFLWDAFWLVFFFIIKELVFNLKLLLEILKFVYKLITDFQGVLDKIRESLGDIADIPSLIRDAFTRTAEHALLHRSRQPPRSVELNLVIYNGIAGQPSTTVVKELRELLWKEHLGLAALPAEMQDVPSDPAIPMNWVEIWKNRANENLEEIKKDQAANAAIKVLEWKPLTEAEEYLRTLKARKKNLRVSARRFDFEKCRFEDKKKSLPCPI